MYKLLAAVIQADVSYIPSTYCSAARIALRHYLVVPSITAPVPACVPFFIVCRPV